MTEPTGPRGSSIGCLVWLGALLAFGAIGAVLWFTVKVGPSDPDSAAVIQKSSGDGIAHANQTTDEGEAAITVDPADTTDARPGSYVYDLQLVQGSAVTTLESGVFTLLADVTRSVA